MVKLRKEFSGRTRLGKHIADGLYFGRKKIFTEYPDLDLDIQNTKKKKTTFTPNEIGCKHCQFFSGCYQARLRKNYLCKNFRGERYNLQVCEDCGNIRIVESEHRVWGLCDPCKQKREQAAYQKELYKKVKQYRIQQLSNGWEEG